MKIKNDELEVQLKDISKNLRDIEDKHNKLLDHAIKLEPIFELYKKQSIGRINILNIDDEIKESLISKIKNEEYYDNIIDIISLVELKTKEALKENKIKKVSYKIKNPYEFKSGA